MIINEDGRVIMTNDAALNFADKRGVARALKAHISEFFTIENQDFIEKSLKSTLEGNTIEEEITIDEFPFLIKTKAVQFEHKTAIHLTIAEMNNHIIRRKFLAAITNSHDSALIDVEKKMTDLYVNQGPISENEFLNVSKYISSQQITKTVLQCLIGDVSVKNEEYDIIVEMGNIIQLY